MKKQNDGGDAFPTLYDSDGGVRYPGMSIRVYFAAKAMEGFISNPDIKDLSCEEVASDSVMHADALIKELGE